MWDSKGICKCCDCYYNRVNLDFEDSHSCGGALCSAGQTGARKWYVIMPLKYKDAALLGKASLTTVCSNNKCNKDVETNIILSETVISEVLIKPL